MDNETFFKMPKVLFTEEYKNLSAEAKLLYGLMLDRMQLSAINGWCDKNGEVFIFYTIAETSEKLGCGHDKATKLQRRGYIKGPVLPFGRRKPVLRRQGLPHWESRHFSAVQNPLILQW